MKKIDLAYVAGIVDGEGNIGIYKSKQSKYFSYRLKVSVANTNEWLIQWLRFNFGGYLFCDERHFRKVDNCKDLWHWELSANKAMGFLELIVPYLRIKKPQAEIAIQFQKGRKRILPQKEIKILREAQSIAQAKIKELNKRGIR